MSPSLSASYKPWDRFGLLNRTWVCLYAKLALMRCHGHEGAVWGFAVGTRGTNVCHSFGKPTPGFPKKTHGDETLQCAQDVSLALVQRDKAKGRQLLKDWMTKSELHELFVVRKLLQMEMDVGDDLRLQTLIPAMYVAEVGNRWFPLQPAGKKVEAKVKSMVETVCGWYEDTQAMVKDLAFGMQAAKGTCPGSGWSSQRRCVTVGCYCNASPCPLPSSRCSWSGWPRCNA